VVALEYQGAVAGSGEKTLEHFAANHANHAVATLVIVYRACLAVRETDDDDFNAAIAVYGQPGVWPTVKSNWQIALEFIIARELAEIGKRSGGLVHGWNVASLTGMRAPSANGRGK
jgi:hypothetical protein